jgi:hypothetical protein
MRFEPKTEQEIANSEIWPGGIYDCEIVEAYEAVSQAGNEMIPLTVRIRRGNKFRLVTDYLVCTRIAKVRNACIAFGLIGKYERGIISGDDFVGKKGRCKVGVERAKKGWGRRNEILEYL